jgi:hypothetical protein
MIFASAAVAGGMIATYGATSVNFMELEVIRFGRSITYTVTNVYAIRMAAVFMISLGTIWVRTRVMPRLFVFLTYGLAVIMLIAVNFTVWLILVFPAWVFIISVYIIIMSFRGDQGSRQ